MKKAIIIISVILFLLLLAGTIWFFIFGDVGSKYAIDEQESEERVFFPTSPPETEEQASIDETTTVEAPIPTSTIPVIEIPTLRQISNKPTSGFATFIREKIVINDISETPEDLPAPVDPDKEEIAYRYVERATGHVYEATDSTLTIERLSNTTIPRIQEVLISPDGLEYILRYFNSSNGTVETFVSLLKEVDKNSTSTTIAIGEESKYMLEGEFLPVNLGEVVYGPEREFAYVSTNISDDGIFNNTGLYISKFKSLGSEIFSSPLSEWIPQWPSKNLLTMTSKADSRLNGVSYHINKTNGASKVVLTDIKGLTTNTSPDGSYVLYSSSRSGGMSTYILNTTTKTATRLSIDTLPEKCVWSEQNKTTLYCAVPSQLPRGDYPEDWYKGIVLFNDNIWRVDVDIQSYHQVLKGSDFPDSRFDVIKPDLDPQEDYITFINKRDLTLWTLKLN